MTTVHVLKSFENKTGHCGNSSLAQVTNGVTDDDLLDPSPDIHALFVQFNSQYFYNKLESVELKWSTRMTLLVSILSS